MTPDDATHTAPPDATRGPADAALDAGLAAAFGSDTTHLRPAQADPEAGTVVAGKYRLTEKIGEGGMGSVWAASQTEPVKRKVAVKLIKAGMDSKAVLARFDAERQALAVMDHPHIAKVLDGGLHDGRPYFVMELVKGVPITEYCDARRLTPAQRLELFVPVCQAIQHAHQKGVIHRDIKPSNVLVALYDDKPVPKVIDFGVAKATGAALTEHTLETGFGAVVGTPAYMSPEQASLNNLDIDTRSDVYALGVLLYELLTGSPPFSGAELKKKGLMEMLRVVREEEPPRPSVKLSTADALPSLSAVRGTEPRALTGLLRNELDWIVMRALEKDRARRYDTANGFAADVQRYLSGEPVQAHPPSAGYRLKKFVRKHKGPLLAAAVVSLALLAGIAGTTFGMLRAEEKRSEAEQAKQREADRADGERRAKEREAEQRAKADQSAAKARAARDRGADILDAMTSNETGEMLATQKAVTPNQRKFLEQALAYYKEYAADSGDDLPTRRRVVRAAQRVGGILVVLTRFDEACATSKTAVEAAKALAADAPSDEHFELLANTLAFAATTHLGRGRWEEAIRVYEEAIAMLGKGDGSPPQGYMLAICLTTKASILAEHGRLDEAERLLEALPSRVPKMPSDTLKSLTVMLQWRTALAEVWVRKGELAKAEAAYLLVLKARLSRPGDESNPLNPPSEIAQIRNQLAAVQLKRGKRAEAEVETRKAVEVFRKLVVDFPSKPSYRMELAQSLSNLHFLVQPAHAAEDATICRELVTLRERLVADFPDEVERRIALAGDYCNLGVTLRNGQRADESLRWFGKAIDTLLPIHQKTPQNTQAKEFLRNSHVGRAVTYVLLQKHVEAVSDWDRVIELSPEAERRTFRVTRAASYVNAGKVAEAVAEAAELLKLPEWDGGQWYDFACVYSVASSKIEGKKADYADRAMALLANAVKGGYKDVAHMKQDTDLDALRDRDDFKKLVAELEKPPGSKK